MQIIIIIFYCFKEQNFCNILLPRALEDIEDHKVTEGTEMSFSISHTHSYGYPKSNWKCKRESWKTKLRDNRMHLNSFVHGQKYISFSSVYLIHIYTTFPPEKKKNIWKQLKTAYFSLQPLILEITSMSEMSPKTLTLCLKGKQPFVWLSARQQGNFIWNTCRCKMVTAIK